MEKKFGFGCMRLPLLKSAIQDSFNYEVIDTLVDTFIDEGFTYFDTAYTYHGYHGEEGVNNALVKRHKREKFSLTTKLPLRDVNSYEDMERVFEEQLKHCGVTYFDYYILHNMGKNVYQKICDIDGFSFVEKLKKEGKVKKIGMSFHDTPELLEEILSMHQELDFIQLQVNYMDMDNPNIQSRRCLEIADFYHMPVIVMEPCKGGMLANVPKEAEVLMKQYNPKASIPSWAIRFAASQKGVMMVLSGMNSLAQVLDNTSYMKEFVPLNEEEYAILEQVIKIINKDVVIPCTACRYCEKGCPKKIAIPDYFSLYNSAVLNKNFSSQGVYYNNLTIDHGLASACVNCKQCEQACPQHIAITTYLKDVVKKFEEESNVPVRK